MLKAWEEVLTQVSCIEFRKAQKGYQGSEIWILSALISILDYLLYRILSAVGRGLGTREVSVLYDGRGYCR